MMKMQIDVFTIFPEMFVGPLQGSILKRAQEKGRVCINIHNIRDFSPDPHKKVDDYPYGGGPGMLMKPEPIFEAVEFVVGQKPAKIILLSPRGELFNQKKAQELAKEDRLIFICGRYEGIDERVREYLATDEISIGDYILNGGELPAMVVIESVVRLMPGVLGAEESACQDSFAEGILEYPQYTRPRDFRGYLVPDVLLSGNHKRIKRWRRKEALRLTRLRRPDLLSKSKLSSQDKILLEELEKEER